MDFILDFFNNIHPFFSSLAGFIILVFVNNILGMSKAGVIDKFDRVKAVRGLMKAAGVITALFLLFFVAQLLPEMRFPLFGGEDVTIQQAISLILTGSIVFYLKDAFLSLVKLMNVVVPNKDNIEKKE